MEKVKRKYKKKVAWLISDEDTLIELWEENIGRLKGSKKNHHIYKEMAQAMQKRNKFFSPEEVRIKIHNLTNRYSKEKQQIRTSNGSPSEWRLYYRIRSIMRKSKSNDEVIVKKEKLSEDNYQTLPVLPQAFKLALPPDSPKQQIKRKYKKKKLWSSNDEEILIELWEENIEKLKGLKKTRHVYEAMEKAMKERNKHFSCEEIIIKIHNLRNRYRREKFAADSSGFASDWPLYYRIQFIMEKFKLDNNESSFEQCVTEDNSQLSLTEEKELLTDHSRHNSVEFSESEEQSYPIDESMSSQIPLEDDTYTMSSSGSISNSENMQISNNIEEQFIKELEKTSKIIEKEFEHMKKHDERIITVETERNKLLERFANDSRRFQEAIITLLANK